jgi:large subunit ribosomal protein L13
MSMNPHKKTYSAKHQDVQAQRAWWVVDAADQPLGRLASLIAVKLRGKDKTIFTPHTDTGDFVVVVNASRVKLTGDKANQKMWYRHSGHPGSMRATPYAELLRTKPEIPINKAVWGMLPKGPLGRKLMKKLKVYGGPDHPHTAQTPKPLAAE